VRPKRADRHYVRLLHLAASTSESEVETALSLLLEQRVLPSFDTVRDLTRPPASHSVPELSQPVLDLSVYDRLQTPEDALRRAREALAFQLSGEVQAIEPPSVELVLRAAA